MTKDEWSRYEKLVTSELDRIDDRLKDLFRRTEELRVNQAMLKVKSGLIAMAVSMVPLLITLMLKFL